MVEYYSIVWLYHILFIHLSVHRYLGCFPFVTIVNNTIKNISLQVFFVGTYFQFSWIIFSGIKLLSQMITVFNLLRKCQTVAATILSQEQEWTFSAI